MRDDRASRLLGRVATSEKLEGCAVERLDAQTQRGDSEPLPRPQSLRRDVLRIRLEEQSGTLRDQQLPASACVPKQVSAELIDAAQYGSPELSSRIYSEIADITGDGIQEVLLDVKTAQQAAEDAAARIDDALR